MKLGVIIVAAGMLILNSARGQSLDAYTKYFKSGDYDNAKKEIDLASSQPQLAQNPKTWLYKAEVYAIIYANNPAQNSGNLEVAYMSLMKANLLDQKKEVATELSAQLTFLSGLYYKKGAGEFNNQKFNFALLSFERSLEISGLMPSSKPDPNIVFYAGISAAMANSNEKAKKHLSSLTSTGFSKAEAYLYLGDIYRNEKNYELASQTYNKGITAVPSASYDLILRLIKMNLSQGKTSDALNYIKKGISSYPNDAELFCMEANMFSMMKQEEDAIASYRKVVQLKPGHVEASNNLGVLLYNRAIKHIMAADNYVNSNPELYRKEKDLYIADLQEAVPNLEVAWKGDSKNKSTGLCLLDAYKRLQRTEKYNSLKSAMGVP